MTPEEARRVVELATPRRNYVAEVRRYLDEAKHRRTIMSRGAVTIDELRAICAPTVRALHFFHYHVPAKNIVELVGRVDRSIRFNRLLILDTLAPFFVIHDLRVGGTSQFGTRPAAVPGDAFAASGSTMYLDLEPISVGSDVVLAVEYVGDEAEGLAFQGMLAGADARDARMRWNLPIRSYEAIRPSLPEIVTLDLDEDRYQFAIRSNQLRVLSRVPRTPGASPMDRGWEVSARSRRDFEPPLPVALHVEHFPEVPYTVLYGIDEATNTVVLEVGEGMASNGRPFSARCEPEGYVPAWWDWRRASEG